MAKAAASKTKSNETKISADITADNQLNTEIVVVSDHSSADADEGSLDFSIKEKLVTLFTLQSIDTRIDRIRVIRGELPLEVRDLEDEVEGLTLRVQNISQEIEDNKRQINEQKIFIKDCLTLIKKYEEQQNNVRNNREFDSLNKEIQYQKLEIEHSEKRIIDLARNLEFKTGVFEESSLAIVERTKDLEEKKVELNDIVSETELDEKKLLKLREELSESIEERLLYSYNRLRTNARNGLAVVCIERDACGGCFNKIPPQRQMEIKLHRKILVCEYCGRILIDEAVVSQVNI